MTSITPIRTAIQHVKPQWCDYNGHMNVAYYTLGFENAGFEAQDIIDFGERYVKEEKLSVFTMKGSYSYLQELKDGVPFYVDYWIIDYAPKLILTLMEMYHAEDGYMAAYTEQLLVHVDLKARRSAPIADHKIALLEQYKQLAGAHPLPRGVGEAIEIKKK